MKNRLLMNMGISLLLTVSLSAGESNAVTISDLKEVTYNLIIDLQKVKNRQTLIANNLNKKLTTIQDEVNLVATDANKTVGDIKQRSILIKKGKSDLDKYLASYVEENVAYLPENCK